MAGGSGGDAKKGVGVLAAAMEPRPDGRGKRRHPTKEPHDIRAAMEPRPDGRGKPCQATHPSHTTPKAAMEPRPDGRGKAAAWDVPMLGGTRRNGAPA